MQRNTTFAFIFLLLLYVSGWADGPQLQPEASAHWYVRDSVLIDRNFPFFEGLLRDVRVNTVLASDPTLSQITASRWQMLSAANRDCKEDLRCKAAAAKFNPQQIADISAELRNVYDQKDELRQFVRHELEGRDEFSLDISKKGADLLVDNWERSAVALDQIIATYCEGVNPRYGEIDSMTYAANSSTYASLIRIIIDGLPIEDYVEDSRPKKQTLFFEPLLRFATRLLQANTHDEAGRFWPLAEGQNRAAIIYSKNVKWAAFPYTAILIPGAGSEVAGVPLSPWGKERLRLGVEAYRTGLAPFIMVSGGFVHPSQTPFCEALEMKRYLMEIYDIPESAILLEPYARHTTTNLRNGVRELIGYGFPEKRPLLIVSDAAQSSYIESDVFAKRNMRELGYQPVILGKRLTPTRQEATPTTHSLYRDPLDPLDP